MQEATYWYWQDDGIEEQIWYFNLLTEMDFLFVHNKIDKLYFEGLTGKRCYELPPVMITDNINTNNNKENAAIIGGNFVSIYSGFDSYVVAREFSDEIYAPSMGRKQKNEEALEINHLPYMTWLEWMNNLSRFKIGVNTTKNVAAGTFALNCSYLGLPCIGYNDLDSQRILHPSTTVDRCDIRRAKELAIRLREDLDFFEKCSSETKKLYNEYYKEDIFCKKLKTIFDYESSIMF